MAISGPSSETTANGLISPMVQTASFRCKHPFPVRQRKRLLPQPPPLLCPLSSMSEVRGKQAQLHGNAAKLGQLSELSSALVIYCLIKLISRSALKIWLSRHCLIKLISCSAPRLWPSWHSQHLSWRNKQGSGGRGTEALCRCAHVRPSIPWDPRESLFPPRDVVLGGPANLLPHPWLPPGQGWGGLSRKPASSPGTVWALHFSLAM